MTSHLRVRQVFLLISSMSLRAKKSLGQNFLRDRVILSKIVEAARVSPGDVVLEVGPGEGDLTQVLLETGAVVSSIEKDQRAIPFLEKKFSQEITQKQYSLLEGDALEITPEDILDISKPYKIVANIPYYITGLLIRQFLEATHQPTSITLVIQKEVAERIARSPKESLLSLSVKVYGTPHYVGTIKAESFNPAPKVDSAILHIDSISQTFFTDSEISPETFFEIIKLGFHQKRKTLVKNLSQRYSKDILKNTLKKLSLSETIRAEDLSLEHWKSLILDIKNHPIE